MDPKKLTKLAALLVLATAATATAPLSAEDAKELNDLKVEAKTNNIDFDAADFIEKHKETVVTGDALGDLITKAVADAVKGIGIDQTAVVKALQDTIKEKGALTAEKVEEIVKAHLGGAGIDQKALVDNIKAAMPTDGLTNASLVKALDEFAKSIRTPSRVVHVDPGLANFPIEHRSGNLSVGQKQLLNLCVMALSPSSKADMVEKGVKTPTDMNDGITAELLNKAQRQGEISMKRARHAALYGRKALTTEGSGSGLELIPSDLSGELMTRLYLESQIAAEFTASEIDMPTNPFTFPLTTTRTTFYTGTEAPSQDPTESTPGTDDIVLTAKKLIGVSDFSYEADEDSIIAVLPMLLDNMGSGAADALEGAIINGDTTGSHMDSDTTGTHHAKLFPGLRKLALAGTSYLDCSSGGISAANIAAARKKMGKWGVRPRDLMLIVGPSGYNDVVNLPETLTFEKVGSAAAARILTGEAASIAGIRIVISSQCREDLNASGVYDNSLKTKGSFLLVYRPSWLMGTRRGFTVETETDKKRQINSVIASFRRAFQPKETPAVTTNPIVVLGYNYTA